MSGIFLFLIETKIGRTIAISVAIAIGFLIGWGMFADHYYVKGWNAAVVAVANKNEEAKRAVEKITRQIDECNRIGGNWDTTLGVCH